MMTHPSNDSMTDRRRYPRLEAPLYARPARRRRLDKQQQVLDVSLGGIRIYSDEKYKENDPLELDLFLRDGTCVQCMARVAWIRPPLDPKVAEYEVGLAFIDVSQATLDLLKSVLVED